MNCNEPDDGLGLSLPFHNKHNPTLKDRGGNSGGKKKHRHLTWVDDDVRNHIIAMAGEFLGTNFFLFFAFAGTQVALDAHTEKFESNGTTIIYHSDPAQLLYISLCFGFSLAVNAWVFFRISGGLFNPAVTLGMCLIGTLPYFRGALLVLSQILGAIAAAGIVSALFPGPLMVQSTLGAGTSVTQGLFIEMFLTAQLIFTIFMLAAEKHKGTFLAPIGIGLSLFIAELTGVYFTGGSCNPARSLAPSVIDHSFPGYHWIYWVGPFLGSLVAAAIFKFNKLLNYETANPDIDSDNDNGEPQIIVAPVQYGNLEKGGKSHPSAQDTVDAVRAAFNNNDLESRAGLGVFPNTDGRRDAGSLEQQRIGSDATLGGTFCRNPPLERTASGTQIPRPDGPVITNIPCDLCDPRVQAICADSSGR